MIKVRPVYKCRRCNSIYLGEIIQMSNRSLSNVQEDTITMASPVVEPHNCNPTLGKGFGYGVLEYAGFDIIDYD